MFGYFFVANGVAVLLFIGLVVMRFEGIIDTPLVWLIVPFAVFVALVSILFVLHYLAAPQSPSEAPSPESTVFTPKATFWAPMWYQRWHPFRFLSDTPLTLSHNNARPELRVGPRTISITALTTNKIPVTDIASVHMRTTKRFVYFDIRTTDGQYYAASFVLRDSEDITEQVTQAFGAIGVNVQSA